MNQYADENSAKPIHVQDLALKPGISELSIDSLVHDFLGMTPSAHLKCQRLHEERSGLSAAKPRPGAVKKCALEWGFWHFGHFARNYRDLFGESPSATLIGRGS